MFEKVTPGLEAPTEGVCSKDAEEAWKGTADALLSDDGKDTGATVASDAGRATG